MIVIKDTDWFLVQFSGKDNETMYGPFESAALAWRYLFGRDPEQSEIETHEAANWSVRPALKQQ